MIEEGDVGEDRAHFATSARRCCRPRALTRRAVRVSLRA
jgi:hypothetical protein